MTKKQKLFKEILDTARRGIKHARWGNISIKKDGSKTWIEADDHTFGFFENGTFFMAWGPYVSGTFTDYNESECNVFWTIVVEIAKKFRKKNRNYLRQQTEYSPNFF